MKFTSFRLASCFICLAPIAATAPAFAQNVPAKVAPDKPTFTSKKYGFALYLPEAPQAQKKELPPRLGGGTTDIYFTPPKPVSYSIVPIVLPVAASGIPQKLYFDSVQQGILMSSKGKAVFSRDVKVNGIPARDFGWSFSTPTPTPDSKTPVNRRAFTKLGAAPFKLRRS